MNMNTHKYEYSSLNIHIFMNKSRCYGPIRGPYPTLTASTPTLIDPWVVLQTGQFKACLKALSKLCTPTNLLYRNGTLQLLLWP